MTVREFVERLLANWKARIKQSDDEVPRVSPHPINGRFFLARRKDNGEGGFVYPCRHYGFLDGSKQVAKMNEARKGTNRGRWQLVPATTDLSMVPTFSSLKES